MGSDGIGIPSRPADDGRATSGSGRLAQPAGAEIAARLESDEKLLCQSPALFGERHDALAVLARGHHADEPGVVAITERRLLFAGAGGSRLVVERHQIDAASLTTRADGSYDLRIVTQAGVAELRGVSANVGSVLAGVRGSTPSAGGAATAVAKRSSEGASPAGHMLAGVLRAHWPSVLTASGALLWTGVLLGVPSASVGDTGLVSALPPSAFLALLLACAGFVAALMLPRTTPRTRLGHLLVVIFMLYGAPHLIADVPTFNVTWRHAGVTTYITDNGSVDPGINAYFNWPGYFMVQALAVELAGLESALGLSRWTPLAFNLLYLAPLLLIARTASGDPRLPWVAASVFYLGNWVYQDYPSPQGLAYVLYLCLVAILLAWLHGRDERSVTPRARAALMIVCFVIVLATVGTHQLTPFAMLAAVTALAALRYSSFRALPAIVLVMTLAWVVFAAGTYLNGHIDALKEQVGQIGATISSSVGSRVSGSEQHVLVTRLRLATAAGLWLLAMLAALRLLRRGAGRFGPHIALAAVPFSLVLLQAYGGEIVLRVYFFSLPFVAVLIASLVPARMGRLAVVGFGIVAAVASAAFLVTRYGNQRIELFTQSEVQLVKHAYEIAPDGALLLAPNPQLPWELTRLGAVRSRTLDSVFKDRPGPPRDLARAIAEVAGDAPTYVLLTRNTREYEMLFGRPRWGTIAQLERSLATSPLFHRGFRNRDGEIFSLRIPQQGAAP